MEFINIRLEMPDKVKDFVDILNNYEGEFELISEKYVVDAKSIMGIFSLNLKEVIKLSIPENINIQNIKNDLKDYIQ